jgi:hypothetical protein
MILLTDYSSGLFFTELFFTELFFTEDGPRNPVGTRDDIGHASGDLGAGAVGGLLFGVGWIARHSGFALGLSAKVDAYVAPYAELPHGEVDNPRRKSDQDQDSDEGSAHGWGP